MILVHGSKLSLAIGAPLCLGLIMLAEPLIFSWVGQEFASSVLPTQILLTVVLVRVSTSSANLILRGAGEHKLLAYTNATTAVVNVLLSIVLIRRLGLIGVALGTLAPITLAAAFVLYPAACRRVELSLREAFAKGIWPAAWPGIAMVVFLSVVRPLAPPGGLLAVAGHLTAGGIVYFALFLTVAIGGEERRFYWTKLRSLFARHRSVSVPG